MSTSRQLHDLWRIVTAIVRKDMVDALRNRMLLTIIVGVLITLATSQALPLLLSLQPTQTIYVYAPDNAELIEALFTSDRLNVRPQESAEAVQAAASAAMVTELGLVFPPHMATLATPVSADGYLAYWITPEAQAAIIQVVEQELQDRAGIAVSVRPHRVFPDAAGSGRHFMASMVLVVVLMVMGVVITPYLLIEEKETHTLDVLRISPASPAQIVVGKALVGLLYCLLAAAVAVLINAALVTNWLLLALSILSGSLFFVMAGLLLGSVFNSQTSLNMVASGITLVLLMPMLLTSLPAPDLPSILRTLIDWVPTSALSRLVRTTLSGGLVDQTTWLDLTSLVLFTLPLVFVVSWRIRHTDQ